MAAPQPIKPAIPNAAPAPVLRVNSPVPVPTAVRATGSLPARDPEKVLLEAAIRLAYAASLRVGKNSAEQAEPKTTQDVVETFNQAKDTAGRMAVICSELKKHGVESLEINKARSQLAGTSPSIPQVILKLSQKALDEHSNLNVGDHRATPQQKAQINLDPDHWSRWKDGEFPKSALAY